MFKYYHTRAMEHLEDIQNGVIDPKSKKCHFCEGDSEISICVCCGRNFCELDGASGTRCLYCRFDQAKRLRKIRIKKCQVQEISNPWKKIKKFTKSSKFQEVLSSKKSKKVEVFKNQKKFYQAKSFQNTNPSRSAQSHKKNPSRRPKIQNFCGASRSPKRFYHRKKNFFLIFKHLYFTFLPPCLQIFLHHPKNLL